MEIKDKDDVIITNTVAVLERWKKDFSKIYAHETRNENDEFKIIVDFYVNSQEADMLDPLFNDYTYSINRNIIQETKMPLSKARHGKSPGVYTLPYEIFQNHTISPRDSSLLTNH